MDMYPTSQPDNIVALAPNMAYVIFVFRFLVPYPYAGEWVLVGRLQAKSRRHSESVARVLRHCGYGCHCQLFDDALLQL